MSPEDFVVEVQRRLISRGRNLGRTGADGVPGIRTMTALNEELPSIPASQRPAVPKRKLRSPFPSPDFRSLLAYYGPPGESGLTTIQLPYPMLLAWDTTTTVTTTRCHRLVADSLVGCLESIRDHYGSREELEAARMHLYGGCYNYRKQRGGQSMSLHAWGAAIDLDPEKNGFMTPWPDLAIMPVEVIEIFEAAGWKSGARAWGRDAMHFQGTT